jgi:hypothetical protein
MVTFTYAFPITLNKGSETCDYCAEDDEFTYQALSRLHGIKACRLHATAASRDVYAYLYSINVIKVEEFITRFPSLGEITSIKVPRSDGSIDTGGNIVLSSYDEFMFVRLTDNGDWVIRVSWISLNGPKVKDIKVADLALSGIDVTPILEALDAGFYKKQYDLREIAKRRGKGNNETTANQEDKGAFIPVENAKYMNTVAE